MGIVITTALLVGYVIGTAITFILTGINYHTNVTASSELKDKFTGRRLYSVPPQAALELERSELARNEREREEYVESRNTECLGYGNVVSNLDRLNEIIPDLEEEVRQRQNDRHRTAWYIIASPTWPVFVSVFLVLLLLAGLQALFVWIIHWPFWSDLFNRGGQPLWFTKWVDARHKRKEAERQAKEAAKIERQKEAKHLDALAANMALDTGAMVAEAVKYVEQQEAR